MTFFKKHKLLLVLIITIFFLGIISLYFREIKQKELQDELGKVEIQNIRIGTGTSKGKLGTAIFGEIKNNGGRVIKIATLKVFFMSESENLSKIHKFYPVNNYSFSDSLPLEPGESKEFGFPIDDVVPENWDGKISVKLIDLKFK